MTGQLEVFVNDIDDTTAETLQQLLREKQQKAEERAGEAEALGMTQLALQDKARAKIAHADAWCQARGIAPLSEEDRAAWVAWLPTGYISLADGEGEQAARMRSRMSEGRVQMLSSYDYYEGVPGHVRRLMREAKGVFTRLEIRTPERQPVQVIDPVLFGHVEHPNGRRDVYTLARWGESDINLISLEEIKRIVAMRSLPRLDASEAWGMAFLGLLFGGVISFMIGFSATASFDVAPSSVFFWIKNVAVTAFVVPLAISAALWLYRGFRIRQFRQEAPALAALV